MGKEDAPVRGAVPVGVEGLLSTHDGLPARYSALRGDLGQARENALPMSASAPGRAAPPADPTRTAVQGQGWVREMEIGSDAHERQLAEAELEAEDELTRQVRTAVLEERRRLHAQLATTLSTAGHTEVSTQAILSQTFELDDEYEKSVLGAQMAFEEAFQPRQELPPAVQTLDADLRQALEGRAAAFEERLRAATTYGRQVSEEEVVKTPVVVVTTPVKEKKKKGKGKKIWSPFVEAEVRDLDKPPHSPAVEAVVAKRKKEQRVLSRTEAPGFAGATRRAAPPDSRLTARAERIRTEALLRGRAMQVLTKLHEPAEEAAVTVAQKLERQRQEVDPFELAEAELGIAVDELLKLRERVHTATTYTSNLEARVRALKKERDLWINRFRTEAFNRATVLQLTTVNNDLQAQANEAEAHAHETVQLLETQTQRQIDLYRETARWRQRYEQATSTELSEGGGLGREELMLELSRAQQEVERLQEQNGKLQDEKRKLVVAQQLRDATAEASAALQRGRRTMLKPGGSPKAGSGAPSLPSSPSNAAALAAVAGGAASKKKEAAAASAMARVVANKFLAQRGGGGNDVGLQPPFHLLLLRVGDRIPFNPKDMSMRKALSVLHDCFQRHVQSTADDPRTLFERSSLGEFLVDCMVQRFALRTVAEKHMLELIAAVRYFLPKSPRMMLFARVVGLIETEEYSNRAGDVYLGLLDRALGEDMQSILNSRTDLLNVPAQLAADVLEETFPEYSLTFSHDRLELHDDIRDGLKNEFTRAINPPPTHYSQKLDGRKIDFDQFCTICMRAFVAQDQRDRRKLAQLFNETTRVKNTLNYTDFADMVNDCCPQALQTSVMMRLFREVHAMCGNVGGTDVVQPEMVALALSMHGITPRYQDHRPPPREHHRRRSSAARTSAPSSPAPTGGSRKVSLRARAPEPLDVLRAQLPAALNVSSPSAAGGPAAGDVGSPMGSRRGSRRMSLLRDLEGTANSRRGSRAELRHAVSSGGSRRGSRVL